ncbi:MAG: hypothetical protein HZB68_04535 [Candidatus Aenigmarchaeota archaeon]|nr:hypothetical protein [Candidatus Aenigmarchaeota archaeon]
MVKIVKDYKNVFKDAAVEYIERIREIAKSNDLDIVNHGLKGWESFPKSICHRKNDREPWANDAVFNYDSEHGTVNIDVYEPRLKQGILELAAEWEMRFGKDTVTIKEFCL